ncbi:MAG: DUF2267 domain-containing protein [Desulfarculus sp.]|nr:DUF2267 domain-containing protein [Pseudomonadota bacterium]MBV1716169.1 DUF2267 domain-containing protein [Desulfarculus sp.]MBU4577000.1 DUF2267 domain-containing protein [Pseudomonadota bacterium]MBU4599751.1 DUF2267 domain-containing protein [Pseudomonadota bacterium]MBV1737207.1 DUF2267 domain-containing protein [Desulfarculus sp.]
MFETRKEFLLEIKSRTGLKSLEEADRLAQTVISLIKSRIGPELSEEVARKISQDLAMGWRSIALPQEAMEMQEMMFELEEGDVKPPQGEQYPPEYG